MDTLYKTLKTRSRIVFNAKEKSRNCGGNKKRSLIAVNTVIYLCHPSSNCIKKYDNRFIL